MYVTYNNNKLVLILTRHTLARAGLANHPSHCVEHPSGRDDLPPSLVFNALIVLLPASIVPPCIAVEYSNDEIRPMVATALQHFLHSTG